MKYLVYKDLGRIYNYLRDNCFPEQPEKSWRDHTKVSPENFLRLMGTWKNVSYKITIKRLLASPLYGPRDFTIHIIRLPYTRSLVFNLRKRDIVSGQYYEHGGEKHFIGFNEFFKRQHL